VRRLFSTFARGWPGVGLLLMRLVAAASLIASAIEKFHPGQPLESTILDTVAIGDGVLLIAGMWTPLAGSLVVIPALWGTLSRHEPPYPGVLLATIGTALALVGPGGYSLDAWLFGWKRIDIER